MIEGVKGKLTTVAFPITKIILEHILHPECFTDTQLCAGVTVAMAWTVLLANWKQNRDILVLPVPKREYSERTKSIPGLLMSCFLAYQVISSHGTDYAGYGCPCFLWGRFWITHIISELKNNKYANTHFYISLDKFRQDRFNSLWPSDAIWWQEIWANIGSGGLMP